MEVNRAEHCGMWHTCLEGTEDFQVIQGMGEHGDQVGLIINGHAAPSTMSILMTQQQLELLKEAITSPKWWQK